MSRRDDSKRVGRGWLEGSIWAVIALFTAIIPIAISPGGLDTFRTPKDLLFLAEGLLLLVLLACERLMRDRNALRPMRWKEQPYLLVGSVVLWTAVTTATSLRPLISMHSAIWVACAAAIFLSILRSAHEKSLNVLYLVLLPAAVNSLICLAQESGLWNPFVFDPGLESTSNIRNSALIGNPNDVGSYLLAPLLASMALFLTAKSNRTTPLLIALLLGAGLFASRTVTAIVATAAALVVMTLLVSWRRALAGIVALAIVAILVVGVWPPMQNRYREISRAVAAKDYNQLLSLRLTAFLAAWNMLKERPLLGVGPGGFGFHYYRHKVAVEKDRPELLRYDRIHVGESVNYPQVHNDHLEILAETGIPGYLLYVIALLTLAAKSLARLPSHDDVLQTLDKRREFARLLSLPLATGVTVLTMAQFPLQLAAPTQILLFLSALCLSWGTPRHA